MCFSRYYKVEGVCTMLESRPDEKSSKKSFILVVMDRLMMLMTQLIMSCSTKVGMMLSLMLHFCNKAMQNLWITVPFSSALRI